MKAISIRQPWVWAILFAGKTVENRSWTPHGPNMRQARVVLGETIALHASKGMTRAEYFDFVETYQAIETGHRDLADPSNPRFGKQTRVEIPKMDDLARGGIVGTARFTTIVDESDSPWFFGPFGLVLADAKPCSLIPFTGSLGFFDVPDSVAREALAA